MDTVTKFLDKGLDLIIAIKSHSISIDKLSIEERKIMLITEMFFDDQVLLYNLNESQP